MKLYLKQRVFTWGDRFTVYDEAGADRFYVEGEVFTFGKKLHLLDTDGRELLFIEQQLLTFRPRYSILEGDRELAEVRKEFSLFTPYYTVAGPNWSVEGDFFDHTYEVKAGDRTVAAVYKEWFTFGDAYAIDVAPDADLLLALATVLVIDACLDDKN